MLFDPGWDRLLCQSCGYKEVIPELVSKIPVPECDFNSALTYASHDWDMETAVFHCSQCNGEIISNKLLLSGSCPFCGSVSLIPAEPEKDLLAPNGIIPFKIREIRAVNIYKDWIKEKFAAPDKLPQLASLNKFTGIYVPFFTFDTLTRNQYTGNVEYISRNSEGTLQSCYQQRAGAFEKFIDDFPVVASKLIASDRMLVSVMKYHTSEAKPYAPDALSGFPAEHHSVGLAEAWGRAMHDMERYIKNDAALKEGADAGDKLHISTQYFNVTYKYLLVPVWISSFTYENRLYSIVINGQTGEIAGQWPKSFGAFLKSMFGHMF